MQSTGRFVALALASALLIGACTGGDEQAGGTGTSGSQDTGPTPAQSLTPGAGTFTYENAGLKVTVDIQGTTGTMQVDNGTDNGLEVPGLYVLDAVDGHQIDVEVLQGAPIAAGDSATFDVALGQVDVDAIGLLVLLFGKDNYGAFVRTG